MARHDAGLRGAKARRKSTEKAPLDFQAIQTDKGEAGTMSDMWWCTINSQVPIIRSAIRLISDQLSRTTRSPPTPRQLLLRRDLTAAGHPRALNHAADAHSAATVGHLRDNLPSVLQGPLNHV